MLSNRIFLRKCIFLVTCLSASAGQFTISCSVPPIVCSYQFKSDISVVISCTLTDYQFSILAITILIACILYHLEKKIIKSEF